MADTFPCPNCHQALGRTAASPPGTQVRCPKCEVIFAVPELDAIQEPTTHELEGRHCPQCEALLAKNDVVCVQCGHNVETGEQLPKARKKKKGGSKKRLWDGDLAMTPRIALACVCAALSLVIASIIFAMGHTGSAVAAFVLGSAFSALGMGTFIRLELVAEQRDRPFLHLTQRFCFIPVQRKKINPRKFTRLIVEHTSDDSGMQTLVLLGLFLCCGVFPGILYLFVFSGRFQVALGEEGLNTVVVYRGWSEQVMQDVSQTLAKETGLEIG